MERTEDLSRFVRAQQGEEFMVPYGTALAEIRQGRKRSHWIWYVFPQIRGLGYSANAHRYGIRDMAEARAYLADPVLGGRLREISAALLALPGDDPTAVLGWPDDMKVCSCMTLFALAAEENSVFHQVLEKYYNGERDGRTLEILGLQG